MTEKITFRMSSAGKCPRALSAEQLGYEAKAAPPWLEQSANEGNWHEKRIKEELFDEGYFVHSEQEELVLEYDRFILTGHIDGMVTEDGPWSAQNSKEPMPSSRLLEIKSMSQFEFDRWMKGGFAAFPQYLAQIACYFEATKLEECLYIVKNRNNGYVDKRIITPMDGLFDTIVQGLTEVSEYVEEGKLFPAEFDLQSIECRRCNYQSLCIPEPAELDKATKEQLDKAVEDIRLGNRLVAEGKEYYDRGKKVLYSHTKASNIRKWKHNELAVLLVNVKENTTYPKDELIAKYGEEELADIAKIKKAYDYLRIDDLEKENNSGK